ncbi:hypothetical protein ACWA33_18595, partial [Pseudomonas aeruginosa]
MSSTQHQLIEQCATRLRGIVEALDNIHDSTPHRWSTDLDDVHSSAESLLALIKDQAPALDVQGLAQPSPAQAEQAEAERPEQPKRYTADVFYHNHFSTLQMEVVRASDFEAFAAAYERIVGALRAVITQLHQHKNDYMDAGQETYRALQNEIREREAEIARLDGLVSVRTAERDAALANVDALAVQMLKLGGTISFAHHRTDQAGQVPQAWLDVQAERRRQIEGEGWTPEHDDEHDNGEMARTAACYALAGSSAPNDGTAALLVSLA